MLLYLKEMRVKHEKTQQQLADCLGISRSTYTRYEIGGRMPTIDTLMRIADLFSISIDALVNPALQDDLSQTLISRIRELTDEDKQNLLRYLDFMQKRTNSAPTAE